MYLVIFDKPGRSLSGWHYGKLHEFEADWVQRSAVAVRDLETAAALAGRLREFGVREIRVFAGRDVTAEVLGRAFGTTYMRRQRGGR